MPGVDDDAIRNTGGQVDDLAMAMIDAAYDREADCRDQICDALFDLGKKRPALVLSSAYSYLKKHNKLQTGHRVVLLQCMERIIKETLSELEPPLAVDVIKQAAMELTVSKEVMPEWQTAASGVLVSLGARFCDEVMDEMLQRFQPGILPHFFVIQTIGNLATSNVYGMVPHLTAVLGTMLPINIKFSEAIIDYCANTDKAPDPSVSKERFEQEIGSAFDVLFNSWLHITKEMKLRVAIVEAIGNMCHLMARDKLEEQLPKILQVILGLYKKHPEPIHVTQGLCSVLDAVCIEGNTVLEPNLDTVLGFLFPQIINPPDYKNPQSIKNHNEVLRCLAIIARSFSGKLTGILLSKLESGNEKMKIGMLTVFKHLINAATESMQDKQEVVVSGLKMMLSEQNNKLKKVFAQVVIAMAHHGYLELEGGQQMIEFIIKQSALKNDPPGKKSPDPEYVSNQALRTMCDHVLQLLTTTVEDMEHVLWPYLLELIVPEQYTEAQGVVCKCLSHLATKKRKEQTEDYEIDFETQANIPKPEALIARLMVLAGRPQNGRNRGIHVLTLMQGLVPNLNENLVELWDTVIPKLIQYLEDASKEDTWNQKNWEDLSLKIPMYNNYPDEKNFMYKCLGVITRKSTKKDFVGKHLDLIFGSVKHSDQTEREGCAIAMGFCAASHLDAVLSKLESVAKTELQQKSSGLFSFMKGEKSEVDIERTKATLMLCYGFVALFSPVSLIVSRMEATILRSIQPYFANVKDTSVKQNLIRTLDLIGDALHPDHLKTTYNFSNRGEFITHLQSYMQMESTTSLTNETRALAMNACSTLVKLDPRLNEAEELDLVKTSIDCIYPLPPNGLPVSKKGKEESYDKTLEAEVLMSATFDALHDLLKEILLKDLTPNGLNTIFKQLSKWFLSIEEYERERSLTTLLIVENFLLENMEPSSNNITDFPTECVILAKLVPRCTDPNIRVRQMAMDCVQCNSMDQPDQMIDALCTLKERIERKT
ncbi:unnamed protein product [Mytilus edulis]|uniref:Maestro heat-like repeat-containing protein family member 1 n=1 Tax=Mytilus edulis TaxID=6550 RepID=A0A8S3TX61_MYTED|nr:unnamed protein product [Mytilus edulis]